MSIHSHSSDNRSDTTDPVELEKLAKQDFEKHVAQGGCPPMTVKEMAAKYEGILRIRNPFSGRGKSTEYLYPAGDTLSDDVLYKLEHPEDD